MTDAQLDAMKERIDMRIWEQLNRVNPHAEKAADILRDAIDALCGVMSLIDDAAREVEDTPDEHRILSLRYEAENLDMAISNMIERLD